MTKFIEMLGCSNKRVISYQISHFMYFCKNMNQTLQQMTNTTIYLLLDTYATTLLPYQINILNTKQP